MSLINAAHYLILFWLVFSSRPIPKLNFSVFCLIFHQWMFQQLKVSSQITDYSNKCSQLNPFFSCVFDSIRLVCPISWCAILSVYSLTNTKCAAGHDKVQILCGLGLETNTVALGVVNFLFKNSSYLFKCNLFIFFLSSGIAGWIYLIWFWNLTEWKTSSFVLWQICHPIHEWKLLIFNSNQEAIW